MTRLIHLVFRLEEISLRRAGLLNRRQSRRAALLEVGARHSCNGHIESVMVRGGATDRVRRASKKIFCKVEETLTC